MFQSLIILITHIYTSSKTLGKHYALNLNHEEDLTPLFDNNHIPHSWIIKTIPWIELIDDIQMFSASNLYSTNITTHKNLGSKLIVSISDILEKILSLHELDTFFLDPTDIHKNQLKQKLYSAITEVAENTLKKSEADLLVSKIIKMDTQKLLEIIEKKKALISQNQPLHTLISEFIDILPQEITLINTHLDLNKSPMIMSLEDSQHIIKKSFYLTFKTNYDGRIINCKTPLYTIQIKSRKIIEISTKELDTFAFIGIFIPLIFIITISLAFLYLLKLFTQKKQSHHTYTQTTQKI